MLLKHRLSMAFGLGLLALQACFAQAPQPAQPSSTASVSGSAAPTASIASSASLPASTTVVSTITTTISSGQSLPTSLTASASSSGSVYYIPVITAIPVSHNATSTAAAPTATANANTNATASASAMGKSSNAALPLHTVIDPAFGVLGAILILTGLPMAFYGHRNRWSSYFLSGFFAVALICISIILKVGVEPAVNPPSNGIRGLFLVAAVIAGAVGGIISIVFWRGAGLLACGLGGFFFGLFLQAVRPGGLIRPVGLRYILYIGLYAIFFTISCIERAHSLMLALATAIIGATALTLGIDCYSSQGLKEFYIRNLGFDSLFSSKYPPTFQNGHFPLVQGMQIELGVLGALILMGFAFQMRLWSDLQSQLSVLKRADERRNMRSKAERAARAVARTAKRDLEAWEARHGYNKTATRNLATRDEESGLGAASTPDFKDSRSRTSSFMTLFRANTDATHLATPTPHTEKLADSPAASNILDATAYPFPAQSGGRRSSQFLEYIQKGPERVEPEGPLRLDLPAITSPLGEVGATPVALPAPEAAGRSRMADGVGSAAPESPSVQPSQQPKSLDIVRASPSEPVPEVDSFRRRSASTAALMDNSATFMDLAKPNAEPHNPGSNTSSNDAEEARRLDHAARHSQSQGIASRTRIEVQTPDPSQSLELATHERTFSNPTSPTRAGIASAVPMAQSQSYQGHLQQNIDEANVDTYAERRRSQVQQSPLPSPGFAPAKTVNGGQSSAVMQARRSLAMRRSDQPAVPWTNPGADNATSTHKRASSADAQLRTRAMSIEELEARHRAKLAALQAPATQTVHEADALRRAKEEWEKKQRLERRRMQEREAQKQAAAAGAANVGSASSSRVASPVQDQHRISSSDARDERRRSRALSATLLEAVGEEARESGGTNKAAEWRKSISGLEQLDPRAAKPSVSATPSGTRPTSPQPSSGLERATANPFPAQPLESRKRLSETDRRRLSQGAGDRSQRRYSQPLLDFNLPNRNQ